MSRIRKFELTRSLDNDVDGPTTSIVLDGFEYSLTFRRDTGPDPPRYVPQFEARLQCTRLPTAPPLIGWAVTASLETHGHERQYKQLTSVRKSFWTRMIWREITVKMTIFSVAEFIDFMGLRVPGPNISYAVDRKKLQDFSPDFKALIEKDAQKTDYYLFNATSDEVKEFVALVRGRASMTDQNVSGFLKIANELGVEDFLKTCEEKVIQSSDAVNNADKLLIANKYNNKELLNDLLQSVETIDHIGDFLPEKIDQLSDSTSAAIFRRIVELHKNIEIEREKIMRSWWEPANGEVLICDI